MSFSNTARIGGRKKQKKKRVEAPLGTRHMGCLTLEDIDIVEWQVGLEVALSENCFLLKPQTLEENCPIGSIECAVFPADVCWFNPN